MTPSAAAVGARVAGMEFVVLGAIAFAVFVAVAPDMLTKAALMVPWGLSLLAILYNVARWLLR